MPSRVVNAVVLIVLGVYHVVAYEEAQRRTAKGEKTMPYLMGRASVKDYATFRQGFDGAEEARKAAGALSSSVYQSVDDPNEVVVEIEFSTADAAKAYMNSEALRERQQRASKQPTRMLVVNKT